MGALRAFFAIFTAPLLALLTVACGGGGGSVAEGGIGGSGVSEGSVSGFGSVFVNGVEYETGRTTEILVQGDTFDGTSDRTVLALGMVVRVEGKVNSDGLTGTADRIIYDSGLRGPAELDSTSQFRLLGQVVRVSATTRFGGSNAAGAVTGLASLADGDYVDVSGFRGAAGDFYATRVAVDGRWESGDEVEVEDIIDGVNEADRTFVMRSGLIVDFSATESLPVEGQLVEVKGAYDEGSRRLIATAISRHDGLIEGKDGDHAEVEGVITAIDGNMLTINGVKVQAPAGITFTLGQRIEAEGELRSGVLIADEIELKAESEFEFKGMVSAFDPIKQTVRLFGKDIAVTANTMIDDKASFFDDLRLEDFLEVHAAMGSGGLVATEISFEDGGEQVIEGPVSAIAPDLARLTIGGIDVDVSQVSGLLADLEVNDEVELIGGWIPSTGMFIATAVDDD